MNTVHSTHHVWLRFVCSFYHQVKAQQRCAVTIYNNHEVVFVSLITNRIINTVNISNECWGTDFTKNRLAIQALPHLRSSNIAYLDTKGQLIVITVIRKHQQQFAFLINEYKFAIR
jgi:hypothetical protein